jgi:hypothetical protein
MVPRLFPTAQLGIRNVPERTLAEHLSKLCIATRGLGSGPGQNRAWIVGSMVATSAPRHISSCRNIFLYPTQNDPLGALQGVLKRLPSKRKISSVGIRSCR